MHWVFKFSLLYLLNYSLIDICTQHGSHIFTAARESHWLLGCSLGIRWSIYCGFSHLTLAFLCWHPLQFLWSGLILGDGAQKTGDFSCTSDQVSLKLDRLKTTVFLVFLCCHTHRRHWCGLLLRQFVSGQPPKKQLSDEGVLPSQVFLVSLSIYLWFLPKYLLSWYIWNEKQK